MDFDLESLEQKVSQLAALCTSLREENQQLRVALEKATQDSSQLKNNMLQASNQLEMLLDALPAEEEES